MSFWPDDINTDEVRSPKEIMHQAGEELTERTGKLTVAIQETRLDDRLVLAFEITNRDSGQLLNLFEAIHRLIEPYPVAINPPKDNIPEFLKSRRYIPGSPGILGLSSMSSAALKVLTESSPGRYVDNELVASTPTGFRDKLTKLLARWCKDTDNQPPRGKSQ